MITKKLKRAKVIKDKMNKSAVVLIERRFMHPLYKKVITRTTRYLVHNPEDKAKVGDVVSIKPTSPISKRKRWTIVEVLEKSTMS